MIETTNLVAVLVLSGTCFAGVLFGIFLSIVVIMRRAMANYKRRKAVADKAIENLQSKVLEEAFVAYPGVPHDRRGNVQNN